MDRMDRDLEEKFTNEVSGIIPPDDLANGHNGHLEFSDDDKRTIKAFILKDSGSLPPVLEKIWPRLKPAPGRLTGDFNLDTLRALYYLIHALPSLGKDLEEERFKKDQEIETLQREKSHAEIAAAHLKSLLLLERRRTRFMVGAVLLLASGVALHDCVEETESSQMPYKK